MLRATALLRNAGCFRREAIHFVRTIQTSDSDIGVLRPRSFGRQVLPCGHAAYMQVLLLLHLYLDVCASWCLSTDQAYISSIVACKSPTASATSNFASATLRSGHQKLSCGWWGGEAAGKTFTCQNAVCKQNATGARTRVAAHSIELSSAGLYRGMRLWL